MRSDQNEDAFLQRVIFNLEPAYSQYKGHMKELDNLSELLACIRKVESVIELNAGVDDMETVKLLRKEVRKARKDLIEMLNQEEYKQVENPIIGYGFQSIMNDFVKSIKDIDQNIFPRQKQSNRSSKYIPPVLQRTSKKISKKVINAMTSGTKYRNFTRMSQWQKKKYNKRIIVIALAWILALGGMLISIAFLTRDYIIAQKHLAVQVERSSTQPMKLPAITICSDEYSIPHFSCFPSSDYPGLPLFALTMYERSNRTFRNNNSGLPQKIFFPNTLSVKKKSPVEKVFVTSRDGTDCLADGFDIQREQNALSTVSVLGTFLNNEFSNTSCRHCLRIGYKHEEIIQPFTFKQSVAEFQPSIQIIVSKSRLFGACQSTFQSNYILLESLISSQLHKYATQLEQRKVLDFNGFNHSILLQSLRKYRMSRYMEFYCNVYFFSGFFYPLIENNSYDITYRFTNQTPDAWEKTGRGPYFSSYLWNTIDPFIVGPNKEVMNRDRYSLGGIRLYAESADDINRSKKAVAPNTEFAVLTRFEGSSTFAFRKRIVLNRTEYKAKKIASSAGQPMSGLVDHFHIGFDFEIFEVERVYRYATMTWSEFVTDILEFVGLFTGVCIYTLIVAPALRIGRHED